MRRTEGQILLAGSGVSISEIGFGCASLMTVPTKRERVRLLSAAVDAGITHFDVARLYGLGAAEGAVGSFVRGRGEALTIATKFGISTSPAVERLRRFQGPVRAFLNAAPNARSAVRGHAGRLHEPRRYIAAEAQQSLDRSLSEMKVGHIDVLFVHDPRPGDQIEFEELRAFFDDVRDAGKIRAWGVSQDAYPAFRPREALGTGGVLQVQHDVLGVSATPESAICFGVLAEAHQRISDWLNADPDRLRRWVSTLDVNPLDPNTLAKLLVSEALGEGRSRAVLYATTQTSRLAVPGQILQDGIDLERLRKFAALVECDRESIVLGGRR